MTVVLPPDLPTSPLPPLPELGYSVAEQVAALRVAVANLGSLITNFNAGGVSETYLEAASIALGNDASSVTSGAIAGVYEALNNVQASAFIMTASGAALDAKAADVGIYRKPAAAASAEAAIAFYPQSPPGSTVVLPSGIILSAPNADPTVGPTLYQTTSTATVNAGATISTLADVVCLQTGSVGNCPAGAINQIVSGVGGYTASNVIGIGGGADTESDEALRERALNAIPAASQCTVFALQQAALRYPGITSAVVYDLTTPPPDLNYPVPGYAQIFCDDGTATLGSITTTNAPFLVPDIGLSVAVGVAKAGVFLVGSTVVVSGPVVGGTQVDSITGLITAINNTFDSTYYTLQVSSIAAGGVGDEIDTGASVHSPNSGALDQFNADLDAGFWKAAGAEVHAWGSTQVGIALYMELYLSQSYLASIASADEVVGAVQRALFNAVNALPIGAPVILSMLIDTAENIGGVSEVPLGTVLINNVNADYGVDNGTVTLEPAATCRIATLADVIVIHAKTVSY